MRKILVTFRVDSSSQMGTGHVVRCLTLAQKLRERGADAFFISREHPGNICSLIEGKGFDLYRLPAGLAVTDSKASQGHGSWLGNSWAEDARQTVELLGTRPQRPDWLVVDHYAIDERWERFVKSSVDRVMVIDDLADRLHDCDLLLDQNLVDGLETRYAGKVPVSCDVLLGPKYALLQDDYLEQKKLKVASAGLLRRIFVFFGGADKENLTARSIAAFISLSRPDIELDVVMSANSGHLPAIRSQLASHKNIRFHVNLPSLAALMCQADLAIGAGGTASWERLCIGLPALVVTLADNQRPIAAELNRRKLVRWLGDQHDVTEQDIGNALREAIRDWPLAGFCDGTGYVDGRGASRVCVKICGTLPIALAVRKARHSDESLLLEWANDPVTRAQAFSTAPIAADTHAGWLGNRLQSCESHHLYIVETSEAEPIGQVRFDLDNGDWIVDYSLAPDFRGRGLGRRLLESAMLQLLAEENGPFVVGRVKVGNLASRRVFESLAFSVEQENSDTLKFARRLEP